MNLLNECDEEEVEKQQQRGQGGEVPPQRDDSGDVEPALGEHQLRVYALHP